MGHHCHCCEGSHGHHCHEGEKEGRGETRRALLSGGLLLAGLLFDGLAGREAWDGLPRLAGYVLAYLPVGWPVVRAACREMAAGEWFSEFTLMALATVGAFCIGEYPEAVAVMLFYAVGEYFQERAVDRARRDIRALVDLKPSVVAVVREGRRENVAPEDVRPGEEIELPAGSRVPLDGNLLGDRAVDFDASALTGESLPRTVVPGGEVAAGMMATTVAVRLRVTKPYAEGTLARILEMVQESASRKAPAELFIRRFARVYTPVVIALAAAIAVLPPLVSELPASGWSAWIYRALVFLVISCPCALVVSVPLAYFSGIGRASRRGILFKGGNYLDALARVDTVVFDKTGTLTVGNLVVTDCRERRDGRGGLSVLQAAASAESLSTHPVARALVACAQDRGVEILRPERVEELPGRGIRAMVGGHRVEVGNERLRPLSGEAEECSVYCWVDGEPAGGFVLSDEPRKEAGQAVAELGKLGIARISVLSGDKEEVVAGVAARLGIGDFHGGLLPADKVEYLRRMLGRAGCRLAFVGDGINDAPSLALAHVGIAMGGAGSDAAVEVADVIVQNDNPARVPEAIRIARATNRLVRMNIGLAIGMKVAVLLLGLLGMAPLWAAVLADTGVALLCVLNVFLFRP